MNFFQEIIIRRHTGASPETFRALISLMMFAVTGSFLYPKFYANINSQFRIHGGGQIKSCADHCTSISLCGKTPTTFTPKL